MRADTIAVLDELKVDRVHIIGFPMGGILAIDLGGNAPERLETITAISVSQNPDGMIPAIAEMNCEPGSAPPPEARDLMPTEEDFARMQAGFAVNPDDSEQFQRTLTSLQAFMTSDWGWSEKELSSIEAPTLIVVGHNDFIPVKHAPRMASMIDAELTVLPDTTHMSFINRADWLALLIENRIGTAIN